MSGWVIESIDGKDVNVSIYRPLLRNSFIELSDEFKKIEKKEFNQC